jgi:hypothetical protein
MKKLFTLFFFSLVAFGTFAQTHTFHEYPAVTMAGDTVYMSQYYGKKVMVVNVASFCAWTPQYETLEDLYQQYQQYNFEIIGFLQMISAIREAVILKLSRLVRITESPFRSWRR